MNDEYEDVEYVGRRKKGQNPLLMRSKVGQAKSSGVKLPPEDYSYGYVTKQVADGAKTALGGWEQHKPNAHARPGRDFVKMNRMAMRQGLYSTKDQAKFRKENDVRLSQGAARKKNRAKKQALQVDKDRVYGVKHSGPSENMQSIIGNQFQREWIQSQKQKAAEERKKRKEKKKRTTAAPTKTSLLRAKRKDNQQPMFKLKKFANVESKVAKVASRSGSKANSTAGNENSNSNSGQQEQAQQQQQQNDSDNNNEPQRKLKRSDSVLTAEILHDDRLTKPDTPLSQVSAQSYAGGATPRSQLLNSSDESSPQS
eukprot:TRINITY_DN33430_c0_g1_i1.p1 TRINITY_DN33430_c0_g1~~TRINITY_DN33430_c0_g1_i1.p1  ORF type:complete len:324 (-),score=192.67 TRINITY_DN33430_c0_g1_i1:1111-2046(-)